LKLVDHKEKIRFLQLDEPFKQYDIVIEIKYDDDNGNPILEEIKVIRAWSVEI